MSGAVRSERRPLIFPDTVAMPGTGKRILWGRAPLPGRWIAKGCDVWRRRGLPMVIPVEFIFSIAWIDPEQVLVYFEG